MKKLNLAIFSTALFLVGVSSCSEYSKKPGTVYMPDMAYSRAYEFYSDNPNMPNGMTAQKPVTGTIARGAILPDHIGEFDTVQAKAHKYDGSLTMAEVEEGGRIYNIHCGVCHGNNLDGNGPLYNGGNGKYPAAPANFKDAKYVNMPVGTMYHAIMYGKNLMGAYASQLDGKQRWQVLAYIKKVQAENGGAPLASYFTVGEPGTTNAANTIAKEEGKLIAAVKKEVETVKTEAATEINKAIIKEAKEVIKEIKKK